MLGDKNLLIYKTEIIKYIHCDAFSWGKICCRKRFEIICIPVLYSWLLALDLNLRSLMRGEFIWSVLRIHLCVFFNGGHSLRLPSASSLNFTLGKRLSWGPNLCNSGQRIKISSCYLKACKTLKILEKQTQMKAGMTKLKMEVMIWTQDEDENTQGGWRKTMEAFTNGWNVIEFGREERIAANMNKTYEHAYMYWCGEVLQMYESETHRHTRDKWEYYVVESTSGSGRERHGGGPYDIANTR